MQLVTFLGSDTILKCIIFKSNFPQRWLLREFAFKTKNSPYCCASVDLENQLQVSSQSVLEKSFKETRRVSWPSDSPVIYSQPYNLSHNVYLIGLTKQSLAKQRKCFQGIWKPAEVVKTSFQSSFAENYGVNVCGYLNIFMPYSLIFQIRAGW